MISPPSGAPKSSSADWGSALRDLDRPSTLVPAPKRATVASIIARGERLAAEERIKKAGESAEAEVVGSQETGETKDKGPQSRAKKAPKKPSVTGQAKQKVKDFFSR